MLIQINNLLTDEEIRWLNNEIKHFRLDFFQIYNTQVISELELLDFKDKLKKYIEENFDIKYNTQSIWINKITDEDVNMDSYHTDTSDMTIVTYFNTDFEGGDFEYYDDENNKIIIKPEINLSLLMNNKVKHRVSKVTSGVRYSLVSFFGVVKKNKKTLI